MLVSMIYQYTKELKFVCIYGSRLYCTFNDKCMFNSTWKGKWTLCGLKKKTKKSFNNNWKNFKDSFMNMESAFYIDKTSS